MNKKTKILLATLIPTGTAVLATAITLPIVLTKKGGGQPTYEGMQLTTLPDGSKGYTSAKETFETGQERSYKVTLLNGNRNIDYFSLFIDGGEKVSLSNYHVLVNGVEQTVGWSFSDNEIRYGGVEELPAGTVIEFQVEIGSLMEPVEAAPVLVINDEPVELSYTEQGTGVIEKGYVGSEKTFIKNKAFTFYAKVSGQDKPINRFGIYEDDGAGEAKPCAISWAKTIKLIKNDGTEVDLANDDWTLSTNEIIPGPGSQIQSITEGTILVTIYIGDENITGLPAFTYRQ